MVSLQRRVWQWQSNKGLQVRSCSRTHSIPIESFVSATETIVRSEGDYKFRSDVRDNTPVGGNDVYQMEILNKNGVVWHIAGGS